ncbi:MAG: DUF983 domain-containing protein [Lutibacter sp.]
MFKKESKLYSILFNKCPRCHEGDFLIGKSLFDLKNAFKMKATCSHCGLKYMKEPSFFYGAMYVNYALSVAVAVATFIISYFFFNLSLRQSFLPILIAIIITAPFAARWSRIIWINIFEHYDANFDKNGHNV